MNGKRMSGLLLIILLGVGGSSPLRLGAEDDIQTLLDRLAARLESAPIASDWNASVRSTETRMDKNWQPQKRTVVTKFVTIRDGKRTEEILRAMETEKGRTKDVTERYAREAAKEAEKIRQKAEQNREPGGRRELDREQLFPFRPDRRADFDFDLLEEGDWEGRPVIILQTRAKTAGDDLYEGRYVIDRDSLDVLRVDLTPSKKPGVLKLIEMAFEFQTLPGGYILPRRTWVRIHVGLVIKNIRIQAEEEYFDVQVLD